MATVRRVGSFLLFAVAAFCVGMQVMIAFFAVPGFARWLALNAEFTGIAMAFLGAAAWVSPGDRWRELGLAMLIGAAVCVGSFAIAIFVPDEQGVVPDIGPLMPHVSLTAGFANLAVVTGIALLLYFKGRGKDE